MKLKMWFFFLRIKKAFAKFYNLDAYKKLRKTFVYTFLKMFALILAILWLQFLLLPRLGYVYTADPLDVNDVEVTAKRCQVTVESGKLRMHNFEELRMHLWLSRTTIEGCEYSGDFVIIIKSTGDRSYIDIAYDETTSFGLSSTNENLYCFGRFSDCYIYNIDSMDSSLWDFEQIAMVFRNCDVSLYHDDDPIFIPDLEDSTKILNRYDTFGLNFDRCLGMNIDGRFNISTLVDNISGPVMKFQFLDISELSCNASGVLEFNDSMEGEKYSVSDRPMAFKMYSQDSMAVFKLDSGWGFFKVDEYDHIHQLSLDARVTSAVICGFELFPSFRNWYYSNLYLAPLMLLSVVISSVAIITKQRKKQ